MAIVSKQLNVFCLCYRRASSLGIEALAQSNAWPVMRHFKPAWWYFDVLSCVCRAEDVFGPCGHRGIWNTGCYSSYFAASAVKDFYVYQCAAELPL